MSAKRMVRLNELLKREIAGALYRVLDGQAVDLAALTVTRVETSSDLRHARVMVSIRDHAEDRDRMLQHLTQRRGAIQQLISRNIILKYTPQLHFTLDESIAQGDHVLQLIHDLERAAPPGDTPPRHAS